MILWIFERFLLIKNYPLEEVQTSSYHTLSGRDADGGMIWPLPVCMTTGNAATGRGDIEQSKARTERGEKQT